MSFRVALLFALALVVAACTGPSAVTTTEGPLTTAGNEEPEKPEKPTVASGELVILDGKGDIVITNPNGTDRRTITANAGDNASYFQPVWSPDSTYIAWGQTEAGRFAVGYQGVDEDEPTVVPMVNRPFYLYWASDGESIGALHSGAAGLDLELVDVASGTSSILDSGAPFYFSWNPSGDRMVTHVGADRFETITTDGDRSTAGTTSADYFAPQWIDNGILHVAGSALVLETPEGSRSEVVRVRGFTAFVANSGGTRAAVQSIRIEEAVSYPGTLREVEIETVPSNRLVVVDIETGEFEVVNEAPAVGFFWSPNGESLLIFAPASSGDALVALVWTAGGGMKEYGTFVPPDSVARELLPFFSQYAQSMSFWSPNSAAFAYPSIVDGRSAIWVQQLDQEDPERVSAGSWVSWSR
ncbi:MAG: hypothetical protein ACC658_03025 [Acidimicrobiia bacterium]